MKFRELITSVKKIDGVASVAIKYRRSQGGYYVANITATTPEIVHEVCSKVKSFLLMYDLPESHLNFEVSEGATKFHYARIFNIFSKEELEAKVQ